MVMCQDVVPKAPPNDRVRAEGPNERPSAVGCGEKNKMTYLFLFHQFLWSNDQYDHICINGYVSKMGGTFLAFAFFGVNNFIELWNTQYKPFSISAI